MSPSSLALAGAVSAGALIALQAPTNALIARPLGTPLGAALVSFLVGTAALGAVVLTTGVRIDPAALKGLPPYAWLGGFYGAIFVVMTTFSAPRIGVAAVVMAALVGQLATAMVLDHFGLLGLQRTPIDAQRLLGLGLILAGVMVVRLN